MGTILLARADNVLLHAQSPGCPSAASSEVLLLNMLGGRVYDKVTSVR